MFQTNIASTVGRPSNSIPAPLSKEDNTKIDEFVKQAMDKIINDFTPNEIVIITRQIIQGTRRYLDNWMETREDEMKQSQERLSNLQSEIEMLYNPERVGAKMSVSNM